MTTNHPAHGHVSLDRLHQISEILSKAAAQSDGGNLGYAMADAVKVIDEMISAEPVGEVSEQRDGLVMDGTVDLGGISTHRIIKGASKMKRLPIGTKFYITPPAPLVPGTSVFDVIANILDGIDRREPDNDGWWETFTGAEFGKGKLEEIRAAMIQAGNSPVNQDNSTCKYCGGTGYFRWQQSENMCPCPCVGCDVPAAPQQEVKNG